MVMAECSAGVHQARAVGQEIERNQQPMKLFMPACDLARVAERQLRLCDGVRHALKKLLGGLDDLAPCITPQIARLKHAYGVF